MPDAVQALLAEAPWLVWTYLAGLVVSTALRGAWPEEHERPRWVLAVLAVSDLLNLHLGGPAKAVGRAIRAEGGDAPPR